jgi:hypothetical protein
VTGTSVLGLKYKDGVLIAADTAGKQRSDCKITSENVVPGSQKLPLLNCGSFLYVGGYIGQSETQVHMGQRHGIKAWSV